MWYHTTVISRCNYYKSLPIRVARCTCVARECATHNRFSLLLCSWVYKHPDKIEGPYTKGNGLMANAAKHGFAQILKACREQVGITQTDLAFECGMSKSTISRAENYKHDYIPPPDTFRRVKEALRRHGCSKNRLGELEEQWQQARAKPGERPEFADAPEVKEVVEALDAWPIDSADRAALGNDLMTVIEYWQRYRIAIDELEKRGEPHAALTGLVGLSDSIENLPRLKARVLLGIARARRYLGETREALDGELSGALALAKKLREEERDLYANTLMLAGDFHRRLGDIDEAIHRYEEASEEFLSVTGTRERALGIATVERKKAGALLFRGEPAEAERMLRTSIQRSKEFGDLQGQIRGGHHRAWALALLGYYDQALDIRQRILETSKKGILSSTETVKAQKYLADIMQTCGYLDNAEMLYIEARQGLRDYSGPILMEQENILRGSIFHGLGETYRKKGKFEQARELLTKSLSLSRGDLFLYALTMRALGKLAMDQMNYDEAGRRLDEAHSAFMGIGNRYYNTAILIDRSDLELRMGDVSKARKWANEALKAASNNRDLSIHYVRALARRAAAGLADTGNEDDAVEDYTKALRSAEELNNAYLFDDVLNNFYDQLAKIKDRGEGKRLHRLIQDANQSLEELRLTNPKIRSSLDEWRSRLQKLG